MAARATQLRWPYKGPPGEDQIMKHPLQKIKNYFRRFTRDTSAIRAVVLRKFHWRFAESAVGGVVQWRR